MNTLEFVLGVEPALQNNPNQQAYYEQLFANGELNMYDSVDRMVMTAYNTLANLGVGLYPIRQQTLQYLQHIPIYDTTEMHLISGYRERAAIAYLIVRGLIQSVPAGMRLRPVFDFVNVPHPAADVPVAGNPAATATTAAPQGLVLDDMEEVHRLAAEEALRPDLEETDTPQMDDEDAPLDDEVHDENADLDF